MQYVCIIHFTFCVEIWLYYSHIIVLFWDRVFNISTLRFGWKLDFVETKAIAIEFKRMQVHAVIQAIQGNERKYKRMQTNASECRQMQSNASECKQMKRMQVNASECKELQANATK